MNTIKIYRNTIAYKKKVFCIDDLYTSDFFVESDFFASKIKFDSYFINELFLSTFQPYLAFKRFIEFEGITKISLDNPSLDLLVFSLDLVKQKGIYLEGYGWNILLWRYRLRANILFIVTAVYLIVCMIRIPYRNVVIKHPDGKFSIVRTISAELKLRNFTFPKHKEDFRSKTSMYSYFGILRRVNWVVQSYFSAFCHISKLRINVQDHTGPHSVVLAYSFYATRMVHTLLYEKLLRAFFKIHPHEIFFTSNNLDRFSLVEEVIAKRFGIVTICVPHGLEYGFRFPKGFSGDVFYATSSHASSHLNTLYNTEKFIFDQSVTERMFTFVSANNNDFKKVVFFTEPRETEVNINIINGLIPKLKSIGVTLFVKLHPKDSKANYSSFDVEYLESLQEALVGNVCFARKSTTLLECIYNRSKAAAILTNSKDEALFYSFPSLQSDAIQITKNIDSLFAWIELNIKNETNN